MGVHLGGNSANSALKGLNLGQGSLRAGIGVLQLRLDASQDGLFDRGGRLFNINRPLLALSNLGQERALKLGLDGLD